MCPPSGIKTVPDSQAYFCSTLNLCKKLPDFILGKVKSFQGRLGKPQKKSSLNGRAIKEKITFFGLFFSNVPKFQRPLSSRGEGGKALMARPLREELFLGGGGFP